MSAPCPLAVMENHAKLWDGREHFGYAREMREARAAVAELVEAARKCCDTGGVYVSDLRAALAKFGGVA